MTDRSGRLERTDGLADTKRDRRPNGVTDSAPPTEVRAGDVCYGFLGFSPYEKNKYQKEKKRRENWISRGNGAVDVWTTKSTDDIQAEANEAEKQLTTASLPASLPAASNVFGSFDRICNEYRFLSFLVVSSRSRPLVAPKRKKCSPSPSASHIASALILCHSDFQCTCLSLYPRMYGEGRPGRHVTSQYSYSSINKSKIRTLW